MFLSKVMNDFEWRLRLSKVIERLCSQNYCAGLHRRLIRLTKNIMNQFTYNEIRQIIFIIYLTLLSNKIFIVKFLDSFLILKQNNIIIK